MCDGGREENTWSSLGVSPVTVICFLVNYNQRTQPSSTGRNNRCDASGRIWVPTSLTNAISMKEAFGVSISSLLR